MNDVDLYGWGEKPARRNNRPARVKLKKPGAKQMAIRGMPTAWKAYETEYRWHENAVRNAKKGRSRPVAGGQNPVTHSAKRVRAHEKIISRLVGKPSKPSAGWKRGPKGGMFKTVNGKKVYKKK